MKFDGITESDGLLQRPSVVSPDPYRNIENLKVGDNHRRHVGIIDDLFWKKGIESLVAAKEHLSGRTLIKGSNSEFFSLKAVFSVVLFEDFVAGIEFGHSFICA